MLQPETVDLIFQNHVEHPTMKYGLGGIVNGAGSYGWGGADGTQFVVDRSKRTCTLFMVQTQHYKAPTYPAFLTLANEACGFVTPRAAGGAPVASRPAPTSAQAQATNTEIVESLGVPYSFERGVDANLLSLDIHAPRIATKAPVVVAYGPAVEHKKAGVADFATALRKNGTRAEIVDVSSFREHQSLMTQFGASDDPVSLAVLEFIESVRSEKADASLGSERVLKLEGEAAAVAAGQLKAYRLRVLMMQFDNNKDGRITKEEMSSNPFLFDGMDANKDGTVTAEEFGDYERQKQPSGQ